jgi:4-hydroxybenzoate polyprenyltransferase/phosphoserine phosphatase
MLVNSQMIERNRMSATENSVLCVDLDGTLINTDLLLETFVLLFKRNFFYLLLIPLWLLKGKAVLKAEIAKRTELNPRALPYNKPFVAWLIEQRGVGREIWLCTASNYRLANIIAQHLNIFSGVIASSDVINLSGSEKARALVEKFGLKKFSYCGNNHVDLKVWRVSHSAVIVNGSAALHKKAKDISPVVGLFNASEGKILAAVKALRLHQWIKNILIFVPLLTAHKLGDTALIGQSLLAFSAFGLCASSVYLLNDLLDLESDRMHVRKSSRPFAAGNLSLLIGFVLSPLILVAAFLVAFNLPQQFLIAISIYYALTFLYSVYLKRFVLVDTITLAGLYTLRIIAGAAAISVPLSFWLLLFSIFFFFSLALVKRYAELHLVTQRGEMGAPGRGYVVGDLPILGSLGVSSGMMGVLVLALYINSPSITVLYSAPESLWPLCVVMIFWVGRVWLKAHRGEMHDDPILFAIKDKISIACGLLSALAMVNAV